MPPSDQGSVEIDYRVAKETEKLRAFHHGREQTPQSAVLLHDLVDHWAERTPNAAALRYEGHDLTYVQLRERSRALALHLKERGIVRGDRLASFLPNRPEIVELLLAASRLGALAVPASPLLRPRQLAHILADSGAKVLLTLNTAAHHLSETLRAMELRPHFLILDPPSPSGAMPTPGHEAAERLYLPIAGDLPRRSVDRDAAAILYTSGSTGRAKGVVVSHLNLVSGASSVSQYLRNCAEDRLLAALPLSFDYGLSQVTTAFNVGACAVLTSYSLPVALMQQVAAEQITGLAGVPTMWSHLAAAEWPAEYVRSLRYITNSGGALRPTLIDSLRKRMPYVDVFCMYGLTEAFRSSYLDPAEIDRRPGSIGKAIPNQELLVLRPDGSPCDPGEPGELVHRGSLVAMGYWNRPEETAAKFRPLGPVWLGNSGLGNSAHDQPARGLVGETAVWSGDLVRRDADGYLYFIGRTDDMIKTSGNRVSPLEVEEVIAEVPGVVEVTALGLPDPLLGQRVVVAVVAAEAANQPFIDRIRKHCRMHLPSYMTPAEIHIVRTLPLNANGKPDRMALAATLPTGNSGAFKALPPDYVPPPEDLG